MNKLHLPYVNMPGEFLTLLKTNLSVVTSPSVVFDPLKHNKALYLILETAFKEFDDGRGLEKTMMALGWSNFRDRMGSVYVYKGIYGNFPSSTNMELVEDIKAFEQKYTDHTVGSFSRLFMLGLYIKLANLELHRENSHHPEIKILDDVGTILKLSQGRSEKIDWLILIVFHLLQCLGSKVIMNTMISGKKFDDLYSLMPQDMRDQMFQNLLAYGASIKEPDVFLYEKV